MRPLLKLEIYNILTSTFIGEVRRARQKKRSRIYVITLVDINKALRLKLKSDLREKLLEYYWLWLEAFSRQLSNQLPPHRPGVDLKIEVEKDA